MKAIEAMIAWTPASYQHSAMAGKILVGPWPDQTGWSDPYSHTVGACFLANHKLRGNSMIARIFLDFHTAVVRDGIPFADAHREFLKIGEYRRAISPEIPGAEGGGDFL